MDVQFFCDNMSDELTTWKGKVNDVVRKLDATSTGDKTKVVPQVNELHMIIEELEDRIGKLRTQCPTAFEEEREELENKFFHLKKEWEGAYEKMSPAEFGG